MPPVRAVKGVRRARKEKPFSFTAPGHDFLGPGTDLERLKYAVPRSKLDLAAKIHDFNYGNRSNSTKESDEQFYEDTKGTGFLGAVARTLIGTKHKLGLDEYYRPTADGELRDSVANSVADTEQDMEGGSENQSESGSGGGLSAEVIGPILPTETGNQVGKFVFKRRFKNLIKTTDMNSCKATFEKYKQNEQGVHNVGHYCWAYTKSEDYMIPYHLTSWVQQIKWEATMKHATSYRINRIGCSIDNVICGEWTTKNNEEVFVPNPEPYFDIYVDKGQYIGYGNLIRMTDVPNGFKYIQPMTASQAEMCKYIYAYAAPIAVVNSVPNTGAIDANNKKTQVNMIDLHDWREMPTVKKIRQGDSFTHIWQNHSLFRKPLTNTFTQNNYVVNGSMLSDPTLLRSGLQNDVSTAWDYGLDVSTAPDYGTYAINVENNLDHGKERKRMREEDEEDIAMTEISDLAFDHQQIRSTNETTKPKDLDLGVGWRRATGHFTVANRTVINKILYTNEDAPEPILIHVPPIIRPNGAIGTLYFNFELTYMLEVECHYDSITHPQKVPLASRAQAEEATHQGFNYDKYLINMLNKHFHGQHPKGMAHGRTVHVYKGSNADNTAGTNSGKYINM